MKGRGGGVIFHICLDRIYKRKRKSKSVILLENKRPTSTVIAKNKSEKLN